MASRRVWANGVVGVIIGMCGVFAIGCGDDDNGADDASVSDAGPSFDADTTDADTTDATIAYDGAPPDAERLDAGPPPNAGVDILFVVDNSGSMQEEQVALTGAFASFMNALETAAGGTLPDVHVGVVSTDLGAGPFNIAGCSGNGDNGALQSAPQGPCSPPDDAYISDIEISPGVRDTNYVGTIAETFECIAQLGIQGCGFEQPLESMRRALNGSVQGNDGFLRAGAALAVIILSDEDDCSTANTQMFDTSQDDLTDPLGPLASFRCFEFGVVCDPDDPRALGVKTDCVVREPSPYMYGTTEYVDFLKSLKPDSWLVVATIQGPTSPVDVQFQQDNLAVRLEPSCTTGDGSAVPGIRLATFSSQFLHDHQGLVCGGIPAALDQIALDIAAALP